jgi:uncharacterized protein
MYQNVEFPSEGAMLRGRLYLPAGAAGPFPTVIMTHGFSATINGMVADRYAEAICSAGFAALLYDHRNFGISGGEPRQQINKWIQGRGYRDAISYALTRPEIDGSRVAIWGDSMSGAVAICVGALDTRVKAVVAQVPACGSQMAPPDPDGSLFAALRETFYHGDVNGTPETTSAPMPVVSFDQHTLPSALPPLTAFRWFIEYGGRYGTLWENSVTLVTLNTKAPFHPGLCVPHYNVPLLMVIAAQDEMPGAESAISRLVFDVAAQPKELIEVDGGHFGLLHFPSPLFDQVSGVQIDFLRKCFLNVRG